MIRQLCMFLFVPTILSGMEYSSNNNLSGCATPKILDSCLQSLAFHYLQYIKTLEHTIDEIKQSEAVCKNSQYLTFYQEQIAQAHRLYKNHSMRDSLSNNNIMSQQVNGRRSLEEIAELHVCTLNQVANLLQEALSYANNMQSNLCQTNTALDLARSFEMQTMQAHLFYAFSEDKNITNNLYALRNIFKNLSTSYDNFGQHQEDTPLCAQTKHHAD